MKSPDRILIDRVCLLNTRVIMFKAIESKSLDKAQRRLKGMKYLKPDLDFGNGVSAKEFESKTEDMQATLDAHNALVTEFIAKMTTSRDVVKQKDQALAETAERMLNTIAAIYGKDSDEYEMVGGTKRSSIAKKKAEKAAAETSETASRNDESLNLIPSTIAQKKGEAIAKKNGNGKVASA
jgi:hypothetical protein